MKISIDVALRNGWNRMITLLFRPFDMSKWLIIGFAAIGVSAETGWVKGSYCDGRFNIVSGRKKIAGTACLVRKSGGWFGVLAHAAINIEGDTQADLAAITAFERGLGLDIPYAPASHTNLVARIRMRG